MVHCFPKKLFFFSYFFSKALPKPEEHRVSHRRIRLSFNNGTLPLALMSLIVFCICHLFLNSLKNRSFELGYYLFFVLTRAVRTSLQEGLNCKSLIVRQSVSLWRPFQSLNSVHTHIPEQCLY